MLASSGIVYPFNSDQVNSAFGKSNHADYLRGYFKTLKAETCIIEENYIDKDFTIDYQKFYCRTFNKPERETTRIHVFSSNFDEKRFFDSIDNNKSDNKEVSYLIESYLGFVVMRPIEDKAKNSIVGRTLVKTYPPKERDIMRVFVTETYPSSLFGVPLKINSLPFQAKDRGVSACATVALWAALHPLKDTFDLPRHSPAEITEMATSFPSSNRRFPSSGLTSEQMMNYINLLGLDVEIIKPKDDDAIHTAVKAYLFAGLPILASLKMTENSETKGKPDEDFLDKRHAVAISGYQMDNGRCIKELYVHDDAFGPYCKVEPDGNFLTWKYDWAPRGYKVKLEDLRIPIYPKVRTTFYHIFDEYLNQRKKWEDNVNQRLETMLSQTQRKAEDEKDSIRKEISNSFKLELILTSNKDYKAFLLGNSIKDKKDSLTKLLPRFIWVMRLYYKFEPIQDSIFDSTSIYAEPLGDVDYQSRNSIFRMK
jgi:hypothetical protein